MTINIFVTILLSVSVSSLAQIVLKSGMSAAVMQKVIADEGLVRALPYALLNGKVILGLSLYAFGAVMWLAVLAYIDVTKAYPFVGLGFLMTLLLGVIVLKEPIDPLRVVGTILVMLGVVLVGRS